MVFQFLNYIFDSFFNFIKRNCMDDIRYQKGFAKNIGVSYQGIFKNDIKKSSNTYQPLFESVTNSLEAIKDSNEPSKEHKIIISLYKNKGLTINNFDKLVVQDTGRGVTEEDFKRIIIYKDMSKGYNNRGSGRFQYLIHFDETIIESIFKEDDNTFKSKLTLSKKDTFLNNYSICRVDEFKALNDNSETFTKVTFKTPILSENSFNNWDLRSIYDSLVSHYTAYFVENKDNLPKFIFKYFEDDIEKESFELEKDDIPSIYKSNDIEIPYFDTVNGITTLSEEKEKFKVTSYKLDADKCLKNDIHLVSKGEKVKEPELKLKSISPKTEFDGKRFIFQVSSEYIDKNDSDDRGYIRITKNKTNDLLNKYITLENIEEYLNNHIVQEYDELQESIKEHNNTLERLKDTLLLNEDDLKGISIGESEEKIIKLAYKSEAERQSEIDSKLILAVNELKQLDPTDDDFQNQLNDKTNELNKKIPLLNKQSLSHYIARRQLLIELFEFILDGKLDVQNDNSRQNNEQLLHSVLFKEGSNDDYGQDLWLLNEDYMYFKGSSNVHLNKIIFNGENILETENLSEEKQNYLNENSGLVNLKRPDILLFPSEGKCIILELKSPDVEVSEHITQINNYATKIYNFQKSNLNINTFYGYLIGENIKELEVQSHDSRFEYSDITETIVRPEYPIRDYFKERGGNIGLLYTEVLSYRALINKTKNRNSIFKDKLFNKSNR